MKNRLKAGAADSRPKPEPGPPTEQLRARNRLQERGIAVEEERLFKYAATGDTEAVKLLLAAGVSPQARDAEPLWTVLGDVAGDGGAVIPPLQPGARP